MKPVLGLLAGATLVLLSPVATSVSLAAGSGLTTYYCAFLSEQDHFNSKGQRLTKAAQIIRQDRANFHRFNLRDEHDETDDLFMSATNRATMEKRVNRGGLTKAQADYIVNNEVYVCIYADETAAGDARIEVSFPD